MEVNILLWLHPFIPDPVEVANYSASLKNHVMWILLVGSFYVPSAPVTATNHIGGSYNSGWVVNLISFAFRRDFTVHDGHGSDALCCQLSISHLSDFCAVLAVFFLARLPPVFFAGALCLEFLAGKYESGLTPSSTLSNMLAKSSATCSCCALSFVLRVSLVGALPVQGMRLCWNMSIWLSCNIMLETSYFTVWTRCIVPAGLKLAFPDSDIFIPGKPPPLNGAKTWVFLSSQYFTNAWSSGYKSAISFSSVRRSLKVLTVVTQHISLQISENLSLWLGPTLLMWFLTSDLKCHWQPFTRCHTKSSPYTSSTALKFAPPSSQTKYWGLNLYPGLLDISDNISLKSRRNKEISMWFSERNSILARLRICFMAGWMSHIANVLKP